MATTSRDLDRRREHRLDENIPFQYLVEERTPEVLGAALAFAEDVYSP
jgi:hypothetical protein